MPKFNVPAEKCSLILFMACTLLLSAMAAGAVANTIVVHPGTSIQAAIAEANPGDSIEVLPGVYHEGSADDLNAITITKDGIQLIGRSTSDESVVLENLGQQSYGIWVSPADTTGPTGQMDVEHPPCATSGAALTGFSLSGFTVRGFQAHGVHLACVHGFNLSHNLAADNQVYGLFPVLSENGVLFRNEVKNTPLDAGLYVGQSDNVLISENTTHDNLFGIQLENSRHCTLFNNRSFHNTVGMFIDRMPNLVRVSAQDNLAAFNILEENNRPDKRPSPRDEVPSGIGILVAAANKTILMNNQILNNNFSGLVVSSLVCPGEPTCGDPNFDPTPNGNHILANNLINNGTVPNPNPLLNPFRADLSWDGTGIDNCWDFNHFTTSVPPTLPSCQ